MRRAIQLISRGARRSSGLPEAKPSSCSSCSLDPTPATTFSSTVQRMDASPVAAAAAHVARGASALPSTAAAAVAMAAPQVAAAPASGLTLSWGSHPVSSLHTRNFAASASDGRRGKPVTEVVEAEEAARMVLADPMSRLMASQGMPVGLSLGKAGPGGAKAGRAAGQADDGDEGDVTRPPPAEPGYQMEAFSDMLRATAAAARRPGPGPGSSSGGGEAGASSSSGGSSSGSSGGGSVSEEGFMAGVQSLGPSLADSWGTTRESPADIARRIAESNFEAERGTDLAELTDVESGSDGDDDDTPMSLSPSEEKYASLEAMSADIKKLDQVFEVLASVPWLSDDEIAEKELKGVAQVGLLGTLEEVGFNIRHQVLCIWAGERGAELAAGPGLQFRDQAALMAILYHTQQLEEAHGQPEAGYLPPPMPQQEEAGKAGDAGSGGGGAEPEGAKQ